MQAVTTVSLGRATLIIRDATGERRIVSSTPATPEKE